MSTQLYLQTYVQNAWNSSAHLRKISTIMALMTPVLMYPQFIQELYHYRTLNMGALGYMIELAAAWMSVALVWQSLHSSHVHQRDVWSHFGFIILGILGTVLFFPWELLGIGSTLLLISMALYENGFHWRRHVMEAIENSAVKYGTAYQELRGILPGSYILIAMGVGISIWIAARTGHLL